MDETKKNIKITPQWAVTIIVGAILTGMVTGAFGAFNILNADHFALVAVGEKVAKLEATSVNKELYEVKQDILCEKIDTLGTKVDKLTIAVNDLYQR